MVLVENDRGANEVHVVRKGSELNIRIVFIVIASVWSRDFDNCYRVRR